MGKHRPDMATLALTLMMICFLARAANCKPTEQNNVMSPSTSEASVLTSDHTLEQSTENNSDNFKDITTQSIVDINNTNISLSIIKSNTTNPITKLAHDIARLYTAVSNFVSPWFSSPQIENVTENSKNETEPEYDDFEDPDPEEDEPDKIASSTLRFVRDVMKTSEKHNLVTSVLTHTGRFLDSGNAPDNLKNNTIIGKVARSLIRHVRDASEGRQNLFQGYYDFAINEYSYKFWAVYMLAATAILLYSAIAAIYYAKFNTTAIDYETYGDIARSGKSTSNNPLGLVGSLVSVNTFQQILDAIASKKYS